MIPTIFLPRGIRNNNPGNLRIGKTRWDGQRQVQADADFVEFDDPVFGLRALMRVLLVYRVKYGLDTVGSVINRFAPPRENATDNYAHCVAKALGVKRTDAIDVTSGPVLAALAAAITRQENGPPPKEKPPGWYPQDTYDRAAALALQRS